MSNPSAKGIGELGICGSGGSVANAIYNPLLPALEMKAAQCAPAKSLLFKTHQKLGNPIAHSPKRIQRWI